MRINYMVTPLSKLADGAVHFDRRMSAHTERSSRENPYLLYPRGNRLCWVPLQVPALSNALRSKRKRQIGAVSLEGKTEVSDTVMEFSPEEWDSFGVHELRFNHFARAGKRCFRPVIDRNTSAAREALDSYLKGVVTPGLRWKEVVEPSRLELTEEAEIHHERLRRELARGHLEFTQAEFDRLGLHGLRRDSFVRVRGASAGEGRQGSWRWFRLDAPPYVLSPTDAVLDLKKHTKSGGGRLRAEAAVRVSPIQISLCEQQLRDSVRLLEHLLRVTGPDALSVAGAEAAASSPAGVVSFAAATALSPRPRSVRVQRLYNQAQDARAAKARARRDAEDAALRLGADHPRVSHLRKLEREEHQKAEKLQREGDRIRLALMRGSLALTKLIEENRRAVKRNGSRFVAAVLAQQRQQKREQYVQLWRGSGRPFESILGLEELPGKAISRKSEDRLRKLELALESDEIFQFRVFARAQLMKDLLDERERQERRAFMGSTLSASTLGQQQSPELPRTAEVDEPTTLWASLQTAMKDLVVETQRAGTSIIGPSAAEAALVRGGVETTPTACSVWLALPKEQRQKLAILSEALSHVCRPPGSNAPFVAAQSAEPVDPAYSSPAAEDSEGDEPELTLHFEMSEFTTTLMADHESYIASADEIARLTLTRFKFGVLVHELSLVHLTLTLEYDSLLLVDMQARLDALGREILRQGPAGKNELVILHRLLRVGELSREIEITYTFESEAVSVVNAPLVARLRRFVAATAETERAALVALVAEVQKAQRALKATTAVALERMLAQRATTLIKVRCRTPEELQARPLIIVPEDHDDLRRREDARRSSLLVLDLGGISLDSHASGLQWRCMSNGIPPKGGEELMNARAAELLASKMAAADATCATVALSDEDWQAASVPEQTLRQNHYVRVSGETGDRYFQPLHQHFDFRLASAKILISPAQEVDWRARLRATSAVGAPDYLLGVDRVSFTANVCVLPHSTIIEDGSLAHVAACVKLEPPDLLVSLSQQHLRALRSTWASLNAGFATPTQRLPVASIEKSSMERSPNSKPRARPKWRSALKWHADMALRTIKVTFVDGTRTMQLEASDAAVRLEMVPDFQARVVLEELQATDLTAPSSADLTSPARLLRVSAPPVQSPGVEQPSASGQPSAQIHGMVLSIVRSSGSSFPRVPPSLLANLTLGQVFLEWNPTTFEALRALVQQQPPAGERRLRIHAPSKQPADSAHPIDVPHSAPPKLTASWPPKFTLNLHAHQAVIMLKERSNTTASSTRAAEALAMLNVDSFGLRVSAVAGALSVDGRLCNLKVTDTSADPSAPYEMLRSSKTSAVTFEYMSESRAHRPYDSSLQVRMGPVCFCYWHRTVLTLVDYIRHDVIKTITGPPKKKKTLSLDVQLESPAVLLPTAPGGVEGVRARLGRVEVTNALGGDVGLIDAICVQAHQKLTLESVLADGALARGGTLATSAPDALAEAFRREGELIHSSTDPHVVVHVEMDTRATEERPLPFRVQVEHRKLHLALSEAQIQHLMGIVHCNFLAELQRRARLFVVHQRERELRAADGAAEHTALAASFAAADQATADAAAFAKEAAAAHKAADAAASRARSSPDDAANTSKLSISADAAKYSMYVIPPEAGGGGQEVAFLDVPRGFTLKLEEACVAFEDVSLSLQSSQVDKADGAVSDAFIIDGDTLTLELAHTSPNPIPKQLQRLGAHLQAFTKPQPEPPSPDPPKQIKVPVRCERLALSLPSKRHERGKADALLFRDIELGLHLHPFVCTRLSGGIGSSDGGLDWSQHQRNHGSTRVSHGQGQTWDATCFSQLPQRAEEASEHSPHAYMHARAWLKRAPKPLLYVEGGVLHDELTSPSGRSEVLIGVNAPALISAGGSCTCCRCLEEVRVRLQCGGSTRRCLREICSLWSPLLRLVCVLLCCLKCARELGACVCTYFVCCCSRRRSRRHTLLPVVEPAAPPAAI